MFSFNTATADDFFSTSSFESLNSTVPAVDPIVPVPAQTSGTGRALSTVNGILRNGLSGYESVLAVKSSIERSKLNRELADIQAQAAFTRGVQAINQGAVSGQVQITDQGQLTNTLLGLPLPVGAQQFVDDLRTVPEFRNANIAIVLGLVAIGYIVLK